MPDNLNYSQQAAIFNPALAKPVTVIGAGSVGSQVVCMLARMGCQRLTVYDFDHVTSHNVPPSAFGRADVTQVKVRALSDRVLADTGTTITARPQAYTGERLSDTVVSCVDTMEARALIWRRVKDNPLVDVFVDTRMSSELVVIYCINPCDPEGIAWYEARLYPTSATEPNLCGRHGIVYVTATAASLACAAIAASWRGEKPRPEITMSLNTITMIE